MFKNAKYKNALEMTLLLNKSLLILGLLSNQSFSIYYRITLHYLLPYIFIYIYIYIDGLPLWNKDQKESGPRRPIRPILDRKLWQQRPEEVCSGVDDIVLRFFHPCILPLKATLRVFSKDSSWLVVRGPASRFSRKVNHCQRSIWHTAKCFFFLISPVILDENWFSVLEKCPAQCS